MDEPRRAPGRVAAPRAAPSQEIAAAEADVAAGRHPSQPVRAGGAAEPVRPHPGSGRPAHAVDLLPRAAALDRRHDRRPSRRRSSASRPASATSCWRGTSADSSWYEAYNPNIIGGDIAGGSHGGMQLAAAAPARRAPLQARRTRACSCARRPRRRAAACTACAGCTRPRPRWARRCADHRRRATPPGGGAATGVRAARRPGRTASRPAATTALVATASSDPTGRTGVSITPIRRARSCHHHRPRAAPSGSASRRARTTGAIDCHVTEPTTCRLVNPIVLSVA